MISPCLNQKGESLKAIKLIIILALISVNHLAVADVGNRDAWGDQGDGTFKNPILPGDFSDPDVIRVGGDYYLDRKSVV